MNKSIFRRAWGDPSALTNIFGDSSSEVAVRMNNLKWIQFLVKVNKVHRLELALSACVQHNLEALKFIMTTFDTKKYSIVISWFIPNVAVNSGFIEGVKYLIHLMDRDSDFFQKGVELNRSELQLKNQIEMMKWTWERNYFRPDGTIDLSELCEMPNFSSAIVLEQDMKNLSRYYLTLDR